MGLAIFPLSLIYREFDLVSVMPNLQFLFLINENAPIEYERLIHVVIVTNHISNQLVKFKIFLQQL